jgi:hypothetical protein
MFAVAPIGARRGVCLGSVCHVAAPFEVLICDLQLLQLRANGQRVGVFVCRGCGCRAKVNNATCMHPTCMHSNCDATHSVESVWRSVWQEDSGGHTAAHHQHTQTETQLPSQ